MFNRVAARHDELRDALAGGQVEAHAFAKMSKEYSELTPIAEAIAELRRPAPSVRTSRPCSPTPR